MARELGRRSQAHAAIEQHADIRAAQVVRRELSKTRLLPSLLTDPQNGRRRKRPQLDPAALADDAAPEDEDAPDPMCRGRSDFLERETGFEAATLTLAKRLKPKK
jgi:hypothetical protein